MINNIKKFISACHFQNMQKQSDLSKVVVVFLVTQTWQILILPKK
jgi:hypothetical protein